MRAIILRSFLHQPKPMKIYAILFSSFLAFYACGAGETNSTQTEREKIKTTAVEGNGAEPAVTNDPNSARAQTAGPKTVRDFFMLLPEKYFMLEGCEHETDKDCRKARIDYLKTFAEVEDTKNGYIKGSCDGAQSCMEMALFKRPDGTYIIGLATAAEMVNDYYFLDYKDGSWTDLSTQVIPAFNKKNMYELPRFGTTVKVFAKKVIEHGDDYEVSEKGAKLYDLEWKDGKFAIKK